MPTISVKKNYIEKLLGKTYSKTEFNEILFDFGLEIDDIVEENGVDVYKVEIPANRYDLLCTEGLVRSLKSYLFEEEYNDFEAKDSQFKILKEEEDNRACIAAAVIKNINFDEDKYNSFISFQEKLCSSIGRNRSIVAIGTHDLDKITFPVKFKSVDKGNLNFVPLRCTEVVNGLDIKKLYEKDIVIGKYFNLIDDHKKYNIFEDSTSAVLSFPPIINSEHSKITLDTQNIFVEITGTNFHKVNTSLKMILSAFDSGDICSVEIVGKEKIKTPVVIKKKYDFTLEEISRELNINLTIGQLVELLKKMMYKTIVQENFITVIVPNVRSDVIHKVDVIEDIAISYGYNKFPRVLPDVNAIGSENILNKFSDKIRLEMALMGFIEVHTLVLISRNENFCNNQLTASVDNYKSLECEVARTSLLPGLLKSVGSNLHCKIPIRIFEVSDVVYLNDANDIGASNNRLLTCIHVGNSSSLEDIQGPLCNLLEKCGIYDYKFVREDIEDVYLKNQSAKLYINDEVYGTIGVCKPEVFISFRIPYSASSFELDVEKIFKTRFNK